MKRMLVLAVCLAAAGCGSSGTTGTHASLGARCRAENLAWAKHYVASLPGPVAPGTVASLAAGLDRTCPG